MKNLLYISILLLISSLSYTSNMNSRSNSWSSNDSNPESFIKKSIIFPSAFFYKNKLYKASVSDNMTKERRCYTTGNINDKKIIIIIKNSINITYCFVPCYTKINANDISKHIAISN